MNDNWGEIRDSALGLRAWRNPGTTAFEAKLRRAGDMTLKRMHAEMPLCFTPWEAHVVLNAPLASGDAAVNARLNATADQWVLRFTGTTGVALANAGSGTTWRPAVDRTWDGLMHLEVTRADGTVLRRRTREWWSVGEERYVSLDRRWPNTTDTLMNFRIVQPYFYLPADVTRIIQPLRIWDSSRGLIWGSAQSSAVLRGMEPFQGDSSGIPSNYWRKLHEQLPTPTEAPTAVVTPAAGGTGVAWAGPVNEGTFTFIQTFVWGGRPVEWQEQPGGVILDPMLESAPSPASTAVVHDGVARNSIVINCTNTDAMMNFFDLAAAALRHGRSGLRIRIYVRRTAIVLPGAGVQNAYSQVETSDRYYLLTEIEPTATTYTAYRTPSYEWTGAVVPDWQRPLRPSTGYYAWATDSEPDQNYEVDVACERLALPFLDDADAPPIRGDAIPTFMELFLYYLCLQDGVDMKSAVVHLNNYNNMKGVPMADLASPGGPIEPTPWGGNTSRRRRYGPFEEEP